MIEQQIDVITPDGAMPTAMFHPETTTRLPAVIVYMDGVGVRPVLFALARRLASQGYFVALPDLFYRSRPYAPFDGATVFKDPAERERIMSLIREVTSARIVVDTAALVETLGVQPLADARRMGVVGYCMGGGAALTAAGEFPGVVHAAASNHGGRLATDAPDSPHVAATRSRGRLYIGYAEHDASFPDEQRERLDAALTAARVPHVMELYHAAHGFALSDLPPYNAAADARHWETLLALFADTIKDN